MRLEDRVRQALDADAARLTPPPRPTVDQLAGRRRRSWPRVAVAAGGAAAAAVVAGLVLLPGLPAPEIGPVQTPTDEGVPGIEATPGIACVPDGCEVWAVKAPVENRPLVDDELVVVLGDEDMVAYETSTGDPRWRVPTPAGVEELGPNLAALSTHGLALLPGQDEPPSDDGSVGSGQLDLYDVTDGSRHGGIDLGLDEARSVSWYGGRLVVEGTRAGQPTVVGLAPDGQVVWEHEGREAALRPEDDDVLLETDGTDVVGIDPSTGEQRWRTRGEPQFPDRRPTDTVLLLDPADGEARLVDVEQGTVEQTFPADEATLARRMGPWVATGTAELIRIHDAATGEELFRHEIPASEGEDDHNEPMPLAQVSWQEVDELIVVAWPPAPGQQDAEVLVYSHDGQQVRSISIEVYAYPDIWLEAVNQQQATVFASSFGTAESQTTGRTIFAINIHEGEVEEVGHGLEQVEQHDEFAAIRNHNGVRVFGPDGEIDVIHGRRLAAPRPLIAYGSEGLIRLDPETLGSSDSEQP